MSGYFQFIPLQQTCIGPPTHPNPLLVALVQWKVHWTLHPLMAFLFLGQLPYKTAHALPHTSCSLFMAFKAMETAFFQSPEGAIIVASFLWSHWSFVHCHQRPQLCEQRRYHPPSSRSTNTRQCNLPLFLFPKNTTTDRFPFPTSIELLPFPLVLYGLYYVYV